MKEGDIVLAQIQQSDGRHKSRPVLIVKSVPPFGDFMVVAISSQLRHHVLGLDTVIEEEDACFYVTGLKASSLIRVGLVATLPSNCTLGKLGHIPPTTLKSIQETLANFITTQPQ